MLWLCNNLPLALENPGLGSQGPSTTFCACIASKTNIVFGFSAYFYISQNNPYILWLYLKTLAIMYLTIYL